MDIKKSVIFMLMILTANCVVAKKKEFLTIVQGDPTILLQPNKTAIYDIDYSKLIVTDGVDPENDMDFRTWMIAQDEDSEKWLKDWEEKDSAECQKTFRDKFNDEIEDGFKLTKLGKHYKVILRPTKVTFRKKVSGGKKFAGIATGLLISGVGSLARQLMGKSVGSGELEVRDLKSDEILLVIGFENLIGEEAYSQISRFKGLYENLCEAINEYLEDYKEELEKEQKRQKKLEKKNKNKD